MSFSLDNRLALCADFVRHGARLADIGTDHAYLPVYLCKKGVCPHAIAADINAEPLKSGEQTVCEAGLKNVIETRLSNGLEKIREDEVDDIVIAGMGGELIAAILENCSFAQNPEKHFILQPMTKSEELVKYLCKNGFEIIKRDCCIAHKKCYTVLLVRFNGENPEVDETFYYAGKLYPRTNEIHRRFIEEHIARLDKRAKGDVHFGMLAERLRRIIDDGNK